MVLLLIWALSLIVHVIVLSLSGVKGGIFTAMQCYGDDKLALRD
ncbi:hypothetical protein PXH81_02625 [Xylella fastidiosa]|nr:hypothetical protein [Xylella fastidiosa]KAF0570854.1 hypothetical protein P305_07650 [Xylella fastidiosa subsp. fastidiosa Mus-1]WDV83446.1 hypothetical protein PXH81_02625 [Xylella fastidiosa]